jgi:type I site-specific restriction endonuclease
MTATPKETKYVSNIHYFGDPVYTYSLKQGIEDGFLAPFKVVRIDLDKDVLGWRPEKGQVDDLGYDIPDQIYNQLDFDRDITFPGRTKMVAERIARTCTPRTRCTRRSCSARTSTTPSGCARRSSTSPRTVRSSPRTIAT